MGILGDLFVAGYCFSPDECDIVQMVVELGAALAGRVFRLGWKCVTEGSGRIP